MELQELVARARILFQGAPKRSQVFELVNSRRSGKEIAKRSGKSLSGTLQDLQKMRDMDLIIARKDDEGKLLKRDESVIYEKHPLLKHLPNHYYEDPTQLPQTKRKKLATKMGTPVHSISVPTEQQILDICRSGEDQLYEFKSAGTDVRTISKEVCAFANTKMGGIVFYGLQDDGSIENADIRQQVFDQKLQNSVRNTISPAISIRIVEKDVLGYRIFLIIVPSWNRKDIYQYEGRVYLRHGTNVFAAKPEEVRQLHSGRAIV